ncbi:glycosyltransferase [Ideonella dechloratans]|uniref:glycosyltransferase n=1 Tax=Ideonella dechloratans TaxID=36863 RepID=UPI0035ADA55E
MTDRQQRDIYLDVTDLILWVRENTKVTGIQRVHMSYALCAQKHGVKFVLFHGRRCEKVELVSAELITYMGQALSGGVVEPKVIYAMCPNARLGVWKDYGDKYSNRPWLGRGLSSLSGLLSWGRSILFEKKGQSPAFKSGDILISVGRGWTVGGYLEGVRRIKETYGVVPMVLLHDVLPIESELKKKKNMRFTNYVKGCFDVFEGFLTSSNFNVREISRYMHQLGGVTKPITKIRFGSNVESNSVEEGDLPGGLRRGEYLLCVGRIDVSKNQALLLEAWLDLVGAGRQSGKKLVFVGTLNGRYTDFKQQMARCAPEVGNYLVLERVSDAQLALLYSACYFTVFPSRAEGYGLPVAESLGAGKLCVASNATSIPEVAGDLADYFDPWKKSQIREKLEYYLEHSEDVRSKEGQIMKRPRYRWDEATSDFLASVRDGREFS